MYIKSGERFLQNRIVISRSWSVIETFPSFEIEFRLKDDEAVYRSNETRLFFYGRFKGSNKEISFIIEKTVPVL